jgi:hypothetical protein
MSERQVHRLGSYAAVRALGVGVALAVAVAGCGGGGAASGAASAGRGASVPSSPGSTVPASSSGGTSTQMSSDLSGNWIGGYDGTFSGTFSLNWKQTGSKLAGTINLSTAGTVPVNGSVKGDAIKFGTVGSTAITYTGTVSGDTMSGTYSTPSGGGSWNGHRP